MSAEVLREAAALMRERAEAARTGRWIADGAVVHADWDSEPRPVAQMFGSIHEGNLRNAEHVASWDPAAALAVADWLEATAEAWPISDPAYETSVRAEALGHRQAVTVARAYLGTDR